MNKSIAILISCFVGVMLIACGTGNAAQKNESTQKAMFSELHG